jgi:hypothetical protein
MSARFYRSFLGASFIKGDYFTGKVIYMAQRSSKRPAMRWDASRTQFDTKQVHDLFGKRTAAILSLAQQDNIFEAKSACERHIKATQEVGAYCCYGNEQALQIWSDWKFGLAALDDALGQIETEAARVAQRKLAGVVAVARGWIRGDQAAADLAA